MCDSASTAHETAHAVSSAPSSRPPIPVSPTYKSPGNRPSSRSGSVDAPGTFVLFVFYLMARAGARMLAAAAPVRLGPAQARRTACVSPISRQVA